MEAKLSKETALQKLIAKGIIKEEADLRKINKSGDSPLHTAVRKNDEETMDLILAVDPSLAILENFHRHTPIATAIIHCKRALVAKMLKAYPNIIKDENGKPWCDSTGRHVLHYLAKYADEKDPNFISVFKASPKEVFTMKDGESNTLTHIAARWGKINLLGLFARKTPETLCMKGMYDLTPGELAQKFGNNETYIFADYLKRKYVKQPKLK